MASTSRPRLTHSQVTSRILAGESLLIYNGHVLRIPPSWLAAHPGGALSILHFVGRDASDEIEACHQPESLAMIKRYSIGEVDYQGGRDCYTEAAEEDVPEGYWRPLLPPVTLGWIWNSKDRKWENDAEPFYPDSDSPSSNILLVEKEKPQTARDTTNSTKSSGPTLASLTPIPPSDPDLSPSIQHRQSLAYKALHQRVIAAGLYETPFVSGYGAEFSRYILLGCLSAYLYRQNWVLTSALFLGLMWHQLMFFVHDLGHMGVTHSWVLDRLAGLGIAAFVGGLSVGWWVDNHNIHHLVTNHPSHDPDIEHLPFLAISPAFFNSIYSSYYKRTLPFDLASRFFVSIQHKLYYIVLSLGRFNLYVQSYTYLFKKAFDTRRARGGRWAWSLEVIGVLVFWAWFGSVLKGCGSWQKALGYVLISHVATSPLHVQIVLSHFSMSTADLGPGESFPHRQLRTTSDVRCHPLLGWIHGGLHIQVTHHLFPRLPRHNLRQASLMVKQFAKEEGLTYAEFGFVEGNGDVIGVLKGVADQVGIMSKVASAEVREAVEKKIRLKEGGGNGAEI